MMRNTSSHLDYAFSWENCFCYKFFTYLFNLYSVPTVSKNKLEICLYLLCCEHTDPTYLSTSVSHSTFPAGDNKANLETTQNDNLPLHKELVQ